MNNKPLLSIAIPSYEAKGFGVSYLEKNFNILLNQTFQDFEVVISDNSKDDNILNLNGDMYYDYGKLYQSILGYDLVLNNCNIDKEYISTMKTYFIKKCNELNLNIEYLSAVTKSLIFGTFYAIELNESK